MCMCKGVVMHSSSICAVISFKRLGISDGKMPSMMVHCFKWCVIKIILSLSIILSGYFTSTHLFMLNNDHLYSCTSLSLSKYCRICYKNTHTCSVIWALIIKLTAELGEAKKSTKYSLQANPHDGYYGSLLKNTWDCCWYQSTRSLHTHTHTHTHTYIYIYIICVCVCVCKSTILSVAMCTHAAY